VQVGYVFANVRPEGGVWAKNLKPSNLGLVSGTLRETAMQGASRRWWVRVGITKVAGGQRVCRCEAGGQGLGQKPETE